MPGHDMWFLYLGVAFLLGLAAYLVGRFTFIPRVTALIVAGVVLGLLAPRVVERIGDQGFEAVTVFALSMVGFLLGGKFDRGNLRRHGGQVLRFSVAIACGTAVVVAVGLILFGLDPALAVVLGAIAAATAPAATVDVVQEEGAKGEFSETLLRVVAFDDVLGLVLFSLALAVVGGSATGEGLFQDPLLSGAWEIVGALLIGFVLGFPMAKVTGRLREGEPTMVEALGVVALGAGVALWAQASVLLTAVVLGAVVVNFASHHERPFHAIEEVEWPFLVIFFLLAGATLETGRVAAAALVLGGFLLLRVAGRVVTGFLAGVGHPGERRMRRWIGLALLPQAGVAIGMAVIAAQRLPEHGEVILAVTLGSTVLFELAGPFFTRLAVRRAGTSSS